MKLVNKVRSLKVISHALVNVTSGCQKETLKPHIYSMNQAMFMAVYW